jgi:HEAT repeat protein
MRRMPLAVLVVLALTLTVTGCSRTQAPSAVKPGTAKSGVAKPAVAEAAAAQPVAAKAVEPAVPAEAAAAPSALDGLVKTLAAAGDSNVRVDAIDEIAKLGQNAKPALDSLVKATEDPELRVRWHAARAIGLIGEDAVSAVPTLLKLISDPDPIVVAQSVTAIGLIHADENATTITESDAAQYAAAKDAVAKATVHADPRVRRSAIRALRTLNPSPEALAPVFGRQLADADPSVVLPALHTLANMEEVAVPVLIEALKEPKGRYWASIALAEIGEEAAPATDPLARIVSEGEIHEKLQAILALAAIGEKASAATPALLAALGSPDKSLRFPAAFALGKIKAREADAALEKVAAEDDEVLASVASWARARIHPGEKPFCQEAMTRLVKGLANANPTVREGSAAALSDLAPDLDDAERKQLAEKFVAMIGDEDPEVGVSAGAALIRLGGLCVDTLRGKLADPKLRLNIMEILSALGPAAKPALDDIVKGLSDADGEYAGDAAVALAAIGPEAAAAIPELRRLLADEKTNPGLRYAAAFALGRIGPAAKAAAGELRALAKSDDEVMATVAVWASLKVEPEDKSLFETAVPLLRRALRGDQEMARLEAAVAIGDIGAAASSAIPILELVSEDDPVKAVRQAAAEALKKIKP